MPLYSVILTISQVKAMTSMIFQINLQQNIYKLLDGKQGETHYKNINHCL